MCARALALLRGMLGDGAAFRPGQQEAVEALVARRQRLLVVQRTGWGKSIVYFLASKLLREAGGGPTLLISPLLSLMRNQVAMARRIGLEARTLHSDNREVWDEIESDLRAGVCDILLVSPERLANDRFRTQTMTAIGGRVGLFVVDEAHCISDWGHDFRPDYRRIVRVLQQLPPGVPVLATTATANNRVIADVCQQLGSNLRVLRGPLARPSLRLVNIELPEASDRLAWLAHFLPKLPGSGVVYCLTIDDTRRVAEWLNLQGIRAAAYHADREGADREQLEQALLANEVKALVATVALGMGFDKPDLGFVVHFQRPASVVAYYQQVGRAGRAVEKGYGFLLGGREDDEIHDYFIGAAFPRTELMREILETLEGVEGMALHELLAVVNVSHTMAEKALKALEVEGAVAVKDRQYFRTANAWRPDEARVERVTALRRAEGDQMRQYLRHQGCLMEFLTRALDDPGAEPCGVCGNCQGKRFATRVPPELAAQAVAFLRTEELLIEPRKQWPAGLFPDEKRTIPPELRNAPGRVLSFYGHPGLGMLVKVGKYSAGSFAVELVEAATELIANRWRPSPAPAWLTCIPSWRHPLVLPMFATALATRLKLPFVPVLSCLREMPEQKTMANSSMQARNALAALAVTGAVPRGPVLLVDDMIDSGWTLAGRLLRQHGTGPIHPFALARATARGN